MHDPALSDEADPLYRALGDWRPWADVVPDAGGWGRAQRDLDDLRRRAPAWTDMVERGARLAAAHQSGALDGVHDGGREDALALLSGVASLRDLGAGVGAHVRANDQAQGLAAGTPAMSEEGVRLVHEVACRPQLTHTVVVDGRAQDHVFAHGEYKHHPNHVPVPGGGWRPRAPVARVGKEMADLVRNLSTPAFSGLHPAVQSAYSMQALAHVGPFADGNGRVARALAGGFLLRGADLPLLMWADDTKAREEAVVAARPADLVELVVRRSVELVGLMVDLHASPPHGQAAALDRWRRQVGVAQALAAVLPGAVRRALDRHRARTDLGWLSPLHGAIVTPGGPGRHDERFDAPPLVLRVPLPDGGAVEEVLAIDPHPPDGGGVVLRAEQAQRTMVVAPDDAPAALTARLEPELERVVSTLALRVAAELE